MSLINIIFAENFLHLLSVKRFSINFIHACFDAFLLERFLNVPGYSYNVWLIFLFDLFLLEIAPDLVCCLYSVHYWHTKVCHNNRVPHAIFVGLFHLVQRLFPCDAEVNLELNVDALTV